MVFCGYFWLAFPIRKSSRLGVSSAAHSGETGKGKCWDEGEPPSLSWASRLLQAQRDAGVIKRAFCLVWHVLCLSLCILNF